MQKDLRTLNLPIDIRILGVNLPSDVSGNSLVVEELPWLQDTVDVNVERLWGAAHRDVRIVGAEGQLVGVFNLTTHNLQISSNYNALGLMFYEAAKAAAADADADQLLDGWERLNFGNLDAKAEDDPDGDGANNFSEYSFGTNPLAADSKPLFAPVLEKSALGLSFRQRSGILLRYVVEESPNMTAWQPATAPTAPFRSLFDGTGTGTIRYRMPVPLGTSAQRFLRVRSEPIPPTIP